MRFKISLASVLCLLLLSMQCAAATCEISCTLKANVSSCHSEPAVQGNNNRKTANQMAGMKRCGTKVQQSKHSTAVTTIMVIESCRNHACSEQIALIKDQSALETHSILDQSGFVPLPFIRHARDAQVNVSLVPLRRATSHISFPVIIRV
jgi:hypothetical protein